jgi:hypothetical protein
MRQRKRNQKDKKKEKMKISGRKEAKEEKKKRKNGIRSTVSVKKKRKEQATVQGSCSNVAFFAGRIQKNGKQFSPVSSCNRPACCENRFA